MAPGRTAGKPPGEGERGIEGLHGRLDGLDAQIGALGPRLDQLAQRLEDVSFEIRVDADKRTRILEARHQALETRWRVMQEHLIELEDQVGRFTREVNERVELAVRGLEHTRETLAASIAYVRRLLRQTDLFGLAEAADGSAKPGERELGDPERPAARGTPA